MNVKLRALWILQWMGLFAVGGMAVSGDLGIIELLIVFAMVTPYWWIKRQRKPNSAKQPTTAEAD